MRMLQLAVIGAILVLNCAAALSQEAFSSEIDDGEGTAAERRRVKRQVKLTQHPGSSSTLNMGLDPYEERLLIILLGSSIAVLFAIVFLIICCRTYRFDRKSMGGAGGLVGGGGIFEQQQQQQQIMMMYGGGQAGRQAYYATGYQPSVAMDPAYLDPGKAGVMPPPQPPPPQQQQQLVDNTAYASLGGFDRPYSQQQRI